MTKRLTKIGVNPDFQELSSFVHELPTVFETGGKVIYKGRNELKEFDVEGKKLIVKSYQLPHLLNRIIYNFFRASKSAYSSRSIMPDIGIIPSPRHSLSQGVMTFSISFMAAGLPSGFTTLG